jgi:hypothetical protein
MYTGQTKGHAMKEHAAITNDRCFADHRAGAMIKLEAPANLGLVVNLHPCHDPRRTADHFRQHRDAPAIQTMRNPVHAHRPYRWRHEIQNPGSPAARPAWLR